MWQAMARPGSGTWCAPPQRQGAASLPPRPLGLPLLWCISPFHQVLVVEEPSRSDHLLQSQTVLTLPLGSLT